MPGSNLITKGGKVAPLAEAGLATASGSLDNAGFMAAMTTMQNEANAASLMQAGLTNTKALVDGLGKTIKGTGESVKQLGPQ